MTEAACLLQTGTSYPTRRGYATPDGRAILVGLKAGSFSIYLDDDPILHLDLDGRWQRGFVDGLHHLKSLDATARVVDRVREGEGLVLRRRTLSFAETTDLDERIRSLAIDLRDGIASTYRPLDPPPGITPLADLAAIDLLERVSLLDPAAWFRQRELFRSTYLGEVFLPPEVVDPLVLQATLGDSSGLGFGGSAVPIDDERTPEEFARHLASVARLAGSRLGHQKRSFLAGPDALRRGPDRLLADLEVATSQPGFPATVDAFLHAHDCPAFDRDAWSSLDARGLKRVVFGLESGSAAVRRLYGRSWADDDLRNWVDACPIRVGLVVLVGTGGDRFADEHARETVRLVESLALPPGTVVSLVGVDELDDRPADDRGFSPLSTEEVAPRRDELKAALQAVLAPRKVKVASCTIEKRWR